MNDDPLFNLREPIRLEKPWGYELIFAHTARYVGKVLHVDQGETLSLQYHEMKEETLFVIQGRVRLTIRSAEVEKELEMSVGDAFHIPPGLIHRIEAIEDADIVEVSTPELEDVVRLEDRYGRVPT